MTDDAPIEPSDLASAAPKRPARVRRGMAVILSSPSGAGKSTLARRLMAWDETLRFSVSATTRAPRDGEVEGEHYYFTDPQEFGRMQVAGEMLEYAEVFGNHYGSPRAPVEAALRAGRDVLFDIDWQGTQQIKAALQGDVVSIFILPPSIAELERRLRARGQDAPDVIEARMSKSESEISHWGEYDYVLVNEDLDATEEVLRGILTAERMRTTRQPWLTGFTRGLASEFAGRQG